VTDWTSTGKCQQNVERPTFQEVSYILPGFAFFDQPARLRSRDNVNRGRYGTTDNNLRVPDDLREAAAKLAKRQGRSADDLAAERVPDGRDRRLTGSM
jgi:hypothetical protein